jgi:hypothetical protein
VAGAALTPARALAADLIGIAFRRGGYVLYGAQHVPALALALDLIDPEGLGHAVTPEVRARARAVLGRSPVAPANGVDIDRVHFLRNRP